MTDSFRSARRFAAPLALGLFAFVASCKEPVGPAQAPPAAESVVRAANAPKSVAGIDYLVDAITIETRFWPAGNFVDLTPNAVTWLQAFPTGVTAADAFNNLSTTTSGYTNTPVALASLSCGTVVPGSKTIDYGDPTTPDDDFYGEADVWTNCVQNPAALASHNNVATRYRILFTSRRNQTLNIRFGVDFAGGVLLVNGGAYNRRVFDEKWDFPWWGGMFEWDNGDVNAAGDYVPLWTTNTDALLTASVPMAPNTQYVIEVVGFESGADGGAAVQFNDGSGWANGVAKVPPTSVQLTASVGTGGGGSIVSSPAGINCGAACVANFAWGTKPTLTATANQYFAFSAWSGACTGTNPCAPLLETAQTVTATFARAQWPVQVTRAGTGQGTVVSTNGLIDCGAVCLAGFPINTSVTLTATGDANSNFTGWSGGCTGTGSCTLSMTQARNVTATFTLKQFALTVVKGGTGAGAVVSDPAGLTCGPTCTANFTINTAVRLTATADGTSDIGGWSIPSCTGTSCVVSMDRAQSVTVTFVRRTQKLTATKSGAGTGTVTSSPAGIDFGLTAWALFPQGTPVTLTATPAAGSMFAGWSGACSGMGTCVVTLGAAEATVNARFEPGSADTTPPTLSCVADPNELWPANHKMKDIRVKVTLTDAGSGAAGFTLVSVTSSEPDDASERTASRDNRGDSRGRDAQNGNSDRKKKHVGSGRHSSDDDCGYEDDDDDDENGDGSTVNDIQGWLVGTADILGQLRAERSGRGTGRVYTLTYRGTDAAGNAATATCTVKVPRDKGDKDDRKDKDDRDGRRS